MKIKKPSLRFLIVVVPSLLILLAGLILSLWIRDYLQLFPSSKFSSDYKERLMNNPTLVLDRNGKQLGSIGGSRTFHIQSISSSADISVLSTILFAKEDRKIISFDGIQNSGALGFMEAGMEVISWRGKARAVYQTFKGSKQGASGLLEQIAGNLYGHHPQNPWFGKSGLMRQLEKKAVKTLNAIRLAPLYNNPQEVVVDYVNLTYTAGMYHGISAFMQKRFNREVADLLVPIDFKRAPLSDGDTDILNMLAYYAGQLTGPANYDPGTAKNPIERYQITKRAEFKKNLVLTQLKDLGVLPETTYLKAVDRKLPFKPGNVANISYNPNIEIIKQEVVNSGGSLFGQYIRTPLIGELQAAANYELLRMRTDLSIKATGQYFPSSFPRIKSLKPVEYGLYSVKVLNRSNRSVTVDLGIRLGSHRFQLPKTLALKSYSHFTPGKWISIGIDQFDKGGKPVISLIQKDPLVKGAFIIKTAVKGDVIAFGGGSYLNANISTGSTFKPFLFKQALELGWTLEDRLDNSCNLSYQLFSNQPYSPRNYGRCDEAAERFERFPTFEMVLKASINKPTINLLSHLTIKLTEKAYREQVDTLFKTYEAKDARVSDLTYYLKENQVSFYIVTEEGGRRFIGKIPYSGRKPLLIFEKLKREKYGELHETSAYEAMAKLLGTSFSDFQRWHTGLAAVKAQFNALQKQYEEGGRQNNEDWHNQVSEIAKLENFYYDAKGNLAFDPYSRDAISFISWELVGDFLEKYNVNEIRLGEFTVADHERFDDWALEYQQITDEEFLQEMFLFHPKFQLLVNLELFKTYIAKLLKIDRSEIKADLSLPLGTHRVSLVSLLDMYSQVLTTTGSEGRENLSTTHFVFPALGDQQEPTNRERSTVEEESDLYRAMQAARTEPGGTSNHLTSPGILAGKTGTDAKYKTYVAVVKLKGQYFLAGAYFGVDLNKHEPLVKSWTAGWTAAIFMDRVVQMMEKQFPELLPDHTEIPVQFDPDFEYDRKPAETSPLPETPEKDPNSKSAVIWNNDGTYQVEEGVSSLEEIRRKEDKEEEPTVLMEYDEEEIEKILKALPEE